MFAIHPPTHPSSLPSIYIHPPPPFSLPPSHPPTHQPTHLQVALKLVQTQGLKGAPARIWSLLMSKACAKTLPTQVKYDYYFQINDDLRFITMGWAEALVAALDRRVVCSSHGCSRLRRFGVAAPTVCLDAALAAHSLVEPCGTSI